jgi:hypothetical protein
MILYNVQHIQGDQKVSVHQMITAQKISKNILNSLNPVFVFVCESVTLTLDNTQSRD